MLRLRPLGEADRIVILFSRERGKLSAVAKGARRPGSRFGARIDFFSRSKLKLHAGRSLDIITEAQSLHSIWERLVDPHTYALLSYVAEYVDGFCEPGLAVPELYDVLCELQQALADGAELEVLVPAVDLRVLAALGLSPELDACARCGSALGRRPLAGGRATLSADAGGLVCRRCAEAEKGSHAHGVVTLGGLELDALRAMRAGPLAQVGRTVDLKIDRHNSLRRATRTFVEYHLGRRVKALELAAQP